MQRQIGKKTNKKSKLATVNTREISKIGGQTNIKNKLGDKKAEKAEKKLSKQRRIEKNFQIMYTEA